MNLTPKQKRLIVVGGGVVVLIGAASLFSGSGPDFSFGEKPAKVESILITGDTRPASLEAVAAQMSEFRRDLSAVKAENERLREQRRSDLTSLTKRLTSDLNSRDASIRAEASQELLRLRSEMELLGMKVEPQPQSAGADAGAEDAAYDESAPLLDLPPAPAPPSPETPPKPTASAAPVGASVAASPVSAAAITKRPAALRLTREETSALFHNQGAGFASPASMTTLPGGAPSGAADAPVQQIRQITNLREAGPGDPDIGGKTVYIPPGALISGVLLTGLDAPGGASASANPTPVLLRIKHQAILPNNFSADVTECFMLLAAYGDLSAERAQMRAEDISCVLRDGTVMTSKIAGFAAGEDGKAGVRGRLVTRQGAFIARAITIGMIDGFAQALSNSTRVTVGAGSGDAAGSIVSGFGSGFSSALDRISDWYLDQADQLFPIIEIDNGRKIEVVLTKGLNFRIDI